MAELGYEVNEKEPEQAFEALPAGEYIVMIMESDYTPTKDGNGMKLSLKYEVIDGPFKGRKIFENLNLENKSKDAENIARRTLNSIGIATGVTKIKDSSMLHGIPMKLELIIKETKERGKENSIKKHLPAKGGASANSNAAEASAGTGTIPKKPWEIK